MTYTRGDTVTRLDGPGTYRIARIAHGKALILPITQGSPHLVDLSRLAQAAAVPTT
ncbi:hypothetical protein [Nocardia brasiliensis]|uniref:hypothetical protein n=1 Tax=Nocardia brasiliensis TaxID=37326 RepID=UPI0024557A03|nr:hypothetical protein [Nocardia brasiliensis]